MNFRRHMPLMRKVATIAAIILLLGQAIAATHVHPGSSQREFSASGIGGIGSACAICAAHLHSSAASAVAPALEAPTLRENLITAAVCTGPLFGCILHCFGRAPPASV
jgi:hypothetical protein